VERDDDGALEVLRDERPDLKSRIPII
jgi:hypothetical protein